MTAGFNVLEEYAVEVRGVDESDEAALHTAVTARLTELLGKIAQEKPSFAAALSTYAAAHLDGNYELKPQVVGWLMADPHSARPIPGVKGRVERTEVIAYLKVLVGIIRDLDRSGLVIILDELDEMRKLPSDGRAKAGPTCATWWIRWAVAFRGCTWCWPAPQRCFPVRGALKTCLRWGESLPRCQHRDGLPEPARTPAAVAALRTGTA